jgi:hypothetical protein
MSVYFKRTVMDLILVIFKVGERVRLLGILFVGSSNNMNNVFCSLWQQKDKCRQPCN